MKRVFVPLLLLFAAAMSCPVPPVVSHPVLPIAKILPAQVKDHDGLHVEGEGVKVVTLVIKFPFTIKAPKGGELYLWKYPVGWTVEDSYTDTLTIKDGGKGEQVVSVLTLKVDWDQKKTVKQAYSVIVQIGDVPIPPGPGPKPPEPVPPGPVTGLRVIFITETADESKYPSGQIAAMYSTKVKEYLDAKCKGGAAGWRRFDKDQDVSKLPEPWPKMWEAIKPQIGKLPQVAIVTDQKGEIFPVPSSVDEMLTLLKKYGGN